MNRQRQPSFIRIPFGPVKGIEWVTNHCLDRFRERAGVTGTAGEVLRHLEKWVDKAVPAELRQGKILKKMLCHGCRSARYFLMGNPKKGMGWIIVAEDATLKTVHKNDSGEWRIPKP